MYWCLVGWWNGYLSTIKILFQASNKTVLELDQPTTFFQTRHLRYCFKYFLRPLQFKSILFRSEKFTSGVPFKNNSQPLTVHWTHSFTILVMKRRRRKKKKYFAFSKAKQHVALNEGCSTDVLYLNGIQLEYLVRCFAHAFRRPVTKNTQSNSK